MDDKHYIYVVVRKDLSPEQQAVQACHAASEASLVNSRHVIGSTLILLGVKNVEELERMCKIARSRVAVRMFCEPDLDNSPTAFATEPMTEDKRELFQDLRTLRFPRGLLYYIKVFLRFIRREIID